MKITRYTHACVQLEVDGVTLVIDPGEFGTIPDLSAADAVLITHDHFDHAHHEAITSAVAKNPDLMVVGPHSLEGALDIPVRVVDGGDRFEVRGVTVEAIGHWQARTSMDDPEIPNVGYLINGVLHPGDALHEMKVDVLLLPIETPWAKNVDREYALREHPPKRLIPIHDATLNDLGLEFSQHTATRLAERVGAQAILLRDGESAEL